MKSLILIRHAKSSWDYNVEDFERPLNHRGLNDAPVMVARLRSKKIEIDAFVSSPAKRALTTAGIFAREYGGSTQQLILIPELYEASVNTFEKVSASLDDTYNTVALFSHNPGITAFANSLTNMSIDDMPTCGVFAVRADIKSWKAFAEKPKTFWFFDYPKSKD